MQPSPALSAPSQAIAPAPRAQRSNNRKSQSNSQSQPRGNNARHAQRTPEQTHTRHQSMPSQQRNAPSSKPDMTNVTILKRSSAAPASKGASPTSALVSEKQTTADGLQLRFEQQQQQQHQHQHQHQHQQQQQQRIHYPNQKPRPQSQQQLPSKARRVQRRKEIEESLAQVDIDLALHQSPPLDPTSPPSSSDSDDSESAMSRLPDSLLASRRRQLGHPPQRHNSAPVVPQLRRGHQDVDAKARQENVYPSRASVTFEVPRPNAPAKVNSADKVMLVEKKSTLYAGPTFHNSPAPESLPIPVFARPTEPAMEKLPPSPAPFFAEAASPQLNSTRPLVVQSPALGWHGHYSVPMPSGHDQLMEISQNLRMLLKIQSQ